MIIAKSVKELQAAYDKLDNKNSVGFVPTMGALHAGHISLVENSSNLCNHTIVSIFVNPTQFNNKADLETYPRDLSKDCQLLEGKGVDIVFAPSVDDIYPNKDERVFDLGGLDNFGEGPRRPGHFNGVAQVVTRLFDIVKPSHAFFGEKDYQQEAIIRFFTKKGNYPIEIIGCPIKREDDGLAMSSRNMLLTQEQREAAPTIYREIKKAKEYMKTLSPKETIKKVTEAINSNNELEVEYIEIVDGDNLSLIENWEQSENIRLWCAVFAHPVRLIDNIKLK